MRVRVLASVGRLEPLTGRQALLWQRKSGRQFHEGWAPGRRRLEGDLLPGDSACRMRGPPGAGWSSLAARRAHNPKVAGSNPAPATTLFAEPPAARRKASC